MGFYRKSISSTIPDVSYHTIFENLKTIGTTNLKNMCKSLTISFILISVPVKYFIQVHVLGFGSKKTWNFIKMCKIIITKKWKELVKHNLVVNVYSVVFLQSTSYTRERIFSSQGPRVLLKNGYVEDLQMKGSIADEKCSQCKRQQILLPSHTLLCQDDTHTVRFVIVNVQTPLKRKKNENRIAWIRTKKWW